MLKHSCVFNTLFCVISVLKNFEVFTQKLILHWEFFTFVVFSTTKNHDFSIQKNNSMMFRIFPKN